MESTPADDKKPSRGMRLLRIGFCIFLPSIPAPQFAPEALCYVLQFVAAVFIVIGVALLHAE